MKNSRKKPRPSGKAPAKPETEAEWCAYRCQLSCRVGREALEGRTRIPGGLTALEYAVYHLLHAVEELGQMNFKVSQHEPEAQGSGPAPSGTSSTPVAASACDACDRAGRDCPIWEPGKWTGKCCEQITAQRDYIPLGLR